MNLNMFTKFFSRKLGVLILLGVLIYQFPDFGDNKVIYAKIASCTVLGFTFMVVNCIQCVAQIFHLDKEPSNGNGEELKKKVGGGAVGNTPTR